MKNLLLNEHPLVILPSLAKKIGLNEAIILQQLHYWLQKSKHEYDGRRWIYNTYEKWQEQFPWWSTRTIQRIMSELEKQNIIIAGNYNKLKIDKTKWYSINYEQIGTSSMTNWHVENDNMSPPLPETTTETNNNITTSEREILNTLKQVTNYPFDYDKDLDYIRTLSTDFPGIDIAAEVKKWSIYKLDKPLKPNANVRLQLRNWMENAGKFKQRPTSSDKLKLLEEL